MFVYSALLALGLVAGAPWWLFRMATAARYREGLRERLGRVPGRLRAAVRGRRVVWVHAVSVGEVLAVTRLVAELERSLRERAPAGSPAWQLVVSTTTRTGQALARERFGAERVFYLPLDFRWAVRAYLRCLQPAAVVLTESELWPRLLRECARSGVPVAVVNARVSDRSFRRARRVRRVWGGVLRRVTLFLAQSDEDARRLRALGAREGGVLVSGNLKFDLDGMKENAMARRIGSLLPQARLAVAGSTLAGEEEILLAQWPAIHRAVPDAVLLLAPRHPERFAEVLQRMTAGGWPTFRCSELLTGTQPNFGDVGIRGGTLLLDTLGDLAAVYGVATVAFVGGSLVPRGGHNPLEPARFGVPVVMGPSFENFRDILRKMQAAAGIRIVKNGEELGRALIELLTNAESAHSLGERGQKLFEREGGATARSIELLMPLILSSPSSERERGGTEAVPRPAEVRS